MSEITFATYNVLDALDNSDIIKNLTKYKNKLLKNKELLSEINNTRKETDNNLLITKRKKIFENKDYQMYMKYYNQLSLIILKINKQYKKYTSTRIHNCY